MKKVVVLVLSIFFLISPSEIRAVKKVLYSVKSSDAHLDLSYGESVTQTFRCQPNIGGIDLKLSGPSDSHFIFRLKPKNAKDWYYQQELTNISFSNRVVYPLGFPPIEDCTEDTWLFEIKSLNQDKILTAHFNSTNLYPEGEMLIANENKRSSNLDLTFRITSNQSFASQIKNHLVSELTKKIKLQSWFWLLYLSLITLVIYLTHQAPAAKT